MEIIRVIGMLKRRAYNDIVHIYLLKYGHSIQEIYFNRGVQLLCALIEHYK